MEIIDFQGIAINTTEIIKFLKQKTRLKDVCEQILREKIIEQAAASRNIVVTPEEIQTEAEEIRRAKRLEKASDTMAWLKEELNTVEEWEMAIKQSLLAKKLARHLFDNKVEPHFVQNRLDFDQCVLYQLVVPYEKLAQELFYQIEEEEISFYQAVHLYDIDENRRYVCGYEGKVYRWNFAPDIAAAIFKTPIPVNEIIGPIKSDLGYHLFRIEDYIPAELTSERHQEIIDRLFKQWLDSELNYAIHSKKLDISRSLQQS